MNTTTTFFHDAPAGGDWNRAFPIGNGRLGAMVFGEVDDERMALNDDTLYKYFQIGDRVRHHGGLNSFEKYDKFIKITY